MKKIKYLIEFLFIKFFFMIFKIIGYKNASNLGARIRINFSDLYLDQKIIKNNIKKCFQILRIKKQIN